MSFPSLPPHKAGGVAQAVPLPTKRQCQENQEPGQLGTWAGRQVRLLDPILEKSPHYSNQPTTNPRDITAISAGLDVHAGQARPSRCAPPQPEAQKHAHHGHCRLSIGSGADVDPDAERNAAWRWRFARRWYAELARVPGPDTCNTSPDTPEQALCLLRAGGGMAWESQASQPPTRAASLFSIGSATWDLLLEDGSLTGGCWGRGRDKGIGVAGCLLGGGKHVSLIHACMRPACCCQHRVGTTVRPPLHHPLSPPHHRLRPDLPHPVYPPLHPKQPARCQPA